MATVDDESIARKLQSVSNAQDSIQSLSLWIIHHKNQHKRIVELWLKVLRKAKVNHRLTLFYLCNDVVQNCKRKHAVMYLSSFQGVLKNAVPHVRDTAIRAKMERIFSIWEERNVYSAEFIAELQGLLSSSPKVATAEVGSVPSYKPSPATNNNSSTSSTSTGAGANTGSSVRPTPDPKLLADFKPEELIEKINNFKKLECEVEMKRTYLQHVKLDLSNMEAVRQLKDRAHGKEFSRQVEDSSGRLEDYVKHLEKLSEAREDLIASLGLSEFFYDEQFREVKIVAHAYKNFGTRIGNVKKKLSDLVQTLPDPMSPIPSPNVDAPSPGNTPPLEPDKDIETVDMELSEDEEPGDTIISPLPGRVAFTTTTKSISKPIPSIREIRMEGTSELDTGETGSENKHESRHHGHHSKRKAALEDSLEKRIAHMLPNLPTGTAKKEREHKHRRKSKEEKSSPKMKSVVAKVIYNSPKSNLQYSPEEGGGTPLTDERPSTPVLDEKSPLGSSSSGSSTQKMNPIDFLSKLISTNQKAGSSGTASSFLTQLTAAVGGKAEQQNGVEEGQGQASAQSWATWKRENQPDVPPPPVSVPMGVPPRPILPPVSMAPPPVLPPVLGVAPPSPDMLPPRAPPPGFGAPPPGAPGVPMPPRFPDFSQPPPASFYPQTSPGQKENWPVSNSLVASSMPQQLQSVPVILGTSGSRPTRSASGEVPPRGGMLSPRDTASPPAFPPPPASAAKPIKGILRNASHHSVLKEVPLLPSQEEAAGGLSSPSASASQTHTPKPPSLPPSPAEMRSRPQFSDGAGPSVDSDADFLEFSEKLKRKTAVGSNTPAQQPSRQPFRVNPRNPNLMTLTPDPNPEEAMDMEMDMDVVNDEDGKEVEEEEEQPEEEEEEEEMKSPDDVIQPIAALGSQLSQHVRSVGRSAPGSKTLQSAVVPIMNPHPPPSSAPFEQIPPAARDYLDDRRFPARREEPHFRGYPPPRGPYYHDYPFPGREAQYDPYRQGGRPPNYFPPQKPRYAPREYDSRYYRY